MKRTVIQILTVKFIHFLKSRIQISLLVHSKISTIINPAIKVAKPDKRLSAVPGSKMQDQLLPD
jgi:hypothetical protein